MDTKKAKIALDKINVLYKNVTSGSSRIPAVEKDLLLSYVREFYDALLHDAPQKDSSDVSRTTKPMPDFEVVSPKVEEKYTPPKIIEITEDKEEPVITPPKPEPVKEVFTPKKVKPVSIKTTSVSNSDFDQLFEYKKATELSEKLSESPIKDLTRSMSINDKLLYVNELFDRDIEAFNETLKVLNRFDTLNDAKGLLSNLADRYDWLGDEKMSIARDFIKLVRRRYL